MYAQQYKYKFWSWWLQLRKEGLTCSLRCRTFRPLRYSGIDPFIWKQRANGVHNSSAVCSSRTGSLLRHTQVWRVHPNWNLDDLNRNDHCTNSCHAISDRIKIDSHKSHPLSSEESGSKRRGGRSDLSTRLCERSQLFYVQTVEPSRTELGLINLLLPLSALRITSQVKPTVYSFHYYQNQSVDVQDAHYLWCMSHHLSHYKVLWNYKFYYVHAGILLDTSVSSKAFEDNPYQSLSARLTADSKLSHLTQ